MIPDPVALALLFPVLIYAAWTDLRFMKLWNLTIFLIFVGFLLVAPWFMPLGDVAFRALVGAGVTLVLILAAAAGAFGGGDAKYLGALVPWIAPEGYPFFAICLCGCLILLVPFLALARRSGALRAATLRWRSWRKRKIPMGVGISAAMLLYLTATALNLPAATG